MFNTGQLSTCMQLECLIDRCGQWIEAGIPGGTVLQNIKAFVTVA